MGGIQGRIEDDDFPAMVFRETASKSGKYRNARCPTAVMFFQRLLIFDSGLFSIQRVGIPDHVRKRTLHCFRLELDSVHLKF
jgi:hypothetical protein